MTPPDAPTRDQRSAGVTVSIAFHVRRIGHGRKRYSIGGEPPLPDPAAAGRVPRVARVLALAHRWQSLIRDGTVRDQASLARLIGISRVRVTQVMDMRRLAPDVQEDVLHLPRVARGRDPVRERDLRRIAATALWAGQRVAWAAVKRRLAERADLDTRRQNR